jgi:hypothetical protein
MKYLLAAIFTSLLVLATACSQAPPPTESASNGIQVHGHWTVTVTNPNGTLDAVHEFDNALTDSGHNLLRAIIAGDAKVVGHIIKPSNQGVFSQGSQYGPSFKCQENTGELVNLTTLQPTVTTDLSIKNPPLTLTAVCTASEVEEGSEIRSVALWLKLDSHHQYNTKGYTGLTMAGKSMSFTWHKFSEDKFIPVVLNQKYAFNVVISFS